MIFYGIHVELSYQPANAAVMPIVSHPVVLNLLWFVAPF